MISFKVFYADVAALSEKSVYHAHYAQLPEARRKKTDTLRFEKDRLLSLGAGLLLQQALEDAGLPYTDMCKGEHGKPYFPAFPAFHFNLSHSGTKVLCAVADRPVGCDTEKVTKANVALAKRFFAPDEYEALLAQPEGARDVFFFRLWTLKESFLKATGCGLSYPLNAFSLIIDPKSISITQKLDAKHYGFYEFALEGGYRCACCIQDDDGKEPPQFIPVFFSDHNENADV